MEKIAFLGLGRMGQPMARRLAAAGYPLTVWNRSPGRADGLTEAASPAEAVAGADVVVTMLSDPQAAAEVAGRFTPALAPGTLWIDMSSIGPRAVAGLRAQLSDGVAMVDAPVVGSVGPATTGDLGIFAGGEDADLERAEPVLAHLGRVRRCGGPGAGAALKVVVIGGIVACVTVLSEVLAVAGELGVPREVALEVLSVRRCGGPGAQRGVGLPGAAGRQGPRPGGRGPGAVGGPAGAAGGPVDRGPGPVGGGGGAAGGVAGFPGT